MPEAADAPQVPAHRAGQRGLQGLGARRVERDVGLVPAPGPAELGRGALQAGIRGGDGRVIVGGDRAAQRLADPRGSVELRGGGWFRVGPALGGQRVAHRVMTPPNRVVQDTRAVMASAGTLPVVPFPVR